MYLKRIVTRNIQSHGEVVIDLPATGLIVFTGDNSNGKSVIVRTTLNIINGALKKPRKRASLVNRDALFGEITYTRSDDVVLTVHITREAAATYYKLEQPGQEPIIRYLADKSYPELIKTFGWHYDPVSGISLNIAEAEDALLFYKTSNKVNGSVIEAATLDITANKVVDNLEVFIKNTKKLRDDWAAEERALSAAKRELKIEDKKPLEIKLDTFKRYMHTLSTIYLPTLPDIEPVPDIKFANVYKPRIPTMKYPRFINACVHIPDILPVAAELQTLREHKCPTCGRGFDCEC